MMRSNSARSAAAQPVRQPYRSLRGWAIGVLLETHAIKECEEHGHMRDRTDPHAWQHAREMAADAPFPGTTPAEAQQVLDDIMRSIGDTCPDCK